MHNDIEENLDTEINDNLTLNESNDSVDDFYGLLITSSSSQVNFYVLTPHQYFLIFTISTQLGLIHPLIAMNVFDEESDNRKQGIRKILFQNNNLFNFNVGVNISGQTKMDNISFFDINLNKEIFCFGDSSGNIAIYK